MNYPPSAGAAGPGFRHAEKPGVDGLHAHGPGRPGQGLSPTGRLFRRTRRRRRRADRHRRHGAHDARLAGAVCLIDDISLAGQASPPGDRRGSRRGWQDLHADSARRPLWLSSLVGCSQRDSVTHHPVQTPRALQRGIRREIRGFVRAARLAKKAGYDGVEVMGSEGYFINEFTTPRVNKRQDEWGGEAAGRYRIAVEIVSASGKLSGRSSSSFTVCPCWTWFPMAIAGKKSWPRPRPSRQPAPPSSIPASAGTKPAFRPLPRWCPGRFHLGDAETEGTRLAYRW